MSDLHERHVSRTIKVAVGLIVFGLTLGALTGVWIGLTW